MKSSNESKNMQETQGVRAYCSPGEIKGNNFFSYRCSACHFLLGKFKEKQDEETIKKIAHRHQCINLNKKDFEEEIR